MNEWISVKQKLPQTNKKYGIPVLVHLKFKTHEAKRFTRVITIISFAGGRFWRNYVGDSKMDDTYANVNDQITHWMPLPKHPKDND